MKMLSSRSFSRLKGPYFQRNKMHISKLHPVTISLSVQARYVNGIGPAPSPLPSSIQQDEEPPPKDTEPERKQSKWSPTLLRMFESACTTLASLVVLGLAGYGYHRYYKYLVLAKMRRAFEPGDPMLEIAFMGRPNSDSVSNEGDGVGEDHWIRKTEQSKIDRIVDGTDKGHYHLLIGEKGTGKSSMLLDAMQKVAGEGISMFEAHADLDIFRIRLGKALDYEFHEDYIGSLFSIKGPREGHNALLDIERAFNKLEKIALNRRKTVGRPLVLIVNSMHLLRDDADGQDLLELMQQRAESWAASSLVTVVFNSDDYWVYERLKQLATRMEVLPVLDLDKPSAISALKQYRTRYHAESPTPAMLEEVYNHVGGRLTFLNHVARSRDMLATCRAICEREKTWFLNKCGILGAEMDDDVMDQQKFASAAMVLAKALVDQEQDLPSYHPEEGHLLPQIPLHKAREIMTRADFIKSYDHINIFTIDAHAMVRADSVPMQNAFRQICAEPGFQAHLQATLDRISAIESLGRTREVVAKDLVQGRYKISSNRSGKGGEIMVEVERAEGVDD